MQTIPDSVIVKILTHRPHLTTLAENLAMYPDRAQVFEQNLATNYLHGTAGPLSALETWYLASCAGGRPYGADSVWIDTTTAAQESGYDASHIVRLIKSGAISGERRKGVWWVRREEVESREHGRGGRPRKPQADD